MSNGNGRLVAPVTRMHVAHITKNQLARALNEQGERVNTLAEHVKVLGRLLVAITLEPEAFHFEDGQVRIDRFAIEKVKAGTQLLIEDFEFAVKLTTTLPGDVPAVEVPQIEVKNELHGVPGKCRALGNVRLNDRRFGRLRQLLRLQGRLSVFSQAVHGEDLTGHTVHQKLEIVDIQLVAGLDVVLLGARRSRRSG